jgi:vacuolar-type H+-ATPase subunit I/STV1
MLTKLNERLENWREDWGNQNKWTLQLDQLERERKEMQVEADRWEAQLKSEKQDVEKLRGLNLSNLFYTFLGKKDEVLDQHQKEVVEATLKYEEAAETVSDMKKEMIDLDAKLRALGNLDAEYKIIIQEKERLIYDTESPMSQTLFEIVEQKAEARVYLKEIKEAITAGDSVLKSLYDAQDSLSSAGNWGTFDMLGGGLIASAVKHSRINDSKGFIHDAQSKMRRFQKELKDIEMRIKVQFETGGMLKFADFFFDGLIVDWVVQGRIRDSEAQTKQQTKRISSIMGKLRNECKKLEVKVASLHKSYIDMVENKT